MKNVRLREQTEKPRLNFAKGENPKRYDEDKAEALEAHTKRIRKELGIKD